MVLKFGVRIPASQKLSIFTKNTHKIILLAGSFYPKISGSATATYLIAKDLSKRGHDITVVVDEGNKQLLKNEDLPFNVEYINSYIDFALGNVGFRDVTIQLHNLLKKSNFDILHTFSYMPMFLFSLMRDLYEFPVIFTFWNTPYKKQRAFGLYKEPELDLQLAKNIIQMQKYDKLILGSKCSYESALFLGADPKITNFTYHGIDIDEFNTDLKIIVILISDFILVTTLLTMTS